MAVTTPTRRPPPKRPSKARVAILDKLADLHTTWVEGAADDAGFEPVGRKRGSDYNVHHVTLDATPEAMDQFHADAAKLFPTSATTATEDVDDPQQQAWAAAVAAFLAAWPTLSTPLVDALVAATAAATPAQLAALNVPQQIVDDIATALERAMGGAANDAAAAEADAAQAQGVVVDPPAVDGTRLAGVAAVTAALIAVAYVAAATRRALQVGSAAAGDAVRDVLTAMGTAATGVVADHIGAALSAAQNTGRRAVWDAHPPTSWVADEHADDRNKCRPCKDIDTTVFTDPDTALAAYPVAGYSGCLGRGRCRGRLRARWT